MSVYNSTNFDFKRTNNEGFRPSMSQDFGEGLKKWQNDHMYRTSSYSQSLYNVRLYSL